MATLTHPVLLRRRICLRGVVQGVGFRPFVYNLAKRIGTRGFILNHRPTTTMADCVMCAECQAEYRDPSNRRFHAQPNACPACGPTVALAKSGSFLPEALAYQFGVLSLSVLTDVRRLLREGAIV